MKKIYTKTGIVIFLALLLQYSAIGQKRLYIANDNHTDFMWTIDSANYVDAFVNMLDTWMNINDATAAANPGTPNFHTKWNCDGSYWVSFYEKVKGTGSASFTRLINQIKSGKITVPYSPLVTAYGGVPVEGVLRGMYYAGDLERKYNIDLSMATAMENQTMPLGIMSLWKGSGAKYAWHGVCACDTKMDRNGFESRQNQIYWAKGLDTNKILLKWYEMLNKDVSTGLGGYAETRDPNTSIDEISAKANTAAYPYNVAAAFGVGHDDVSTLTDALVPAAIAKTNGLQNVIVSNEEDFFRDFETTYGSGLPTITKTFGNEWDLNCTSIAEISSKVKRAVEKLRAAEAMAAIVINYDATFMGPLSTLKQEAWESIGLYWEHSIGFNSINVSQTERIAFQQRLQNDITSYTDALYNLAKSNLGNLITNGTANTRFYAFNPLSWVRTDYADYEYSGTQSIHVVEVTTNTEVPVQFITKNGVNYLRILAGNIPSLGYKVYEIRSGAGSSSFPDAGTVLGNVIENDFFKITYTNQGVLTSILDKLNSNKELVTVTNGRYVNDMGSGLGNAGTVIFNTGKVSLTLTATSAAPLAHTTKITVFKNINRIEIDNTITQNFNDSVRTWSYSFNAAAPEVWHEETGAIIKAKLTNNGGHYATQNARYDWSTLNHFASVNETSGYGISLSNQDCYFMKIGNSTVTSLDEGPNSAQLNVLAGGKIGGLGFDNQGGDNEFNQRFAITTHTSYNAAAEMKKALEHQNFMVCGTVVSPVNFLLPDEFSFLSVNDANTIIWCVKPSEEGNTRGIVTRAWNFSDAGVAPVLSYALLIDDPYRTTHVETDIAPVSFTAGTRDLPIQLGNNEMRTYRVKLSPVALAARNITLKGERTGDVNEINWKMNIEDGIKHYIIERSADGTNFTPVATVNKANGNYYYTDKNINTALIYFYRIKLIGQDGSRHYSYTIFIKAAKDAASLIVFPNPAVTDINASLILDKKTRCYVTVINAAGVAVKTPAAPLFEKGYNTYSLSVKELPAGEYTLVISTGEQKFVKPFIKK